MRTTVRLRLQIPGFAGGRMFISPIMTCPGPPREPALVWYGVSGQAELAGLLGKDSLGTEVEEAQDAQANDDPLQGGSEASRAESRNVSRQLVEGDRHQQGAHHDTQVVARSPDNHRSEIDKRLGVDPRVRSPAAYELDECRTTHRGQRAADDH